MQQACTTQLLHTEKCVAGRMRQYPIHNDCLKYFEGTQTFFCNDNYTTVTEIDYPNSPDCSGGSTKYAMRLNIDACFSESLVLY